MDYSATGKLEEAIKELSDRNPEWYQNVGPNLRFFWTEGDPATELKKAEARLYGARGIEIPKFTSLTSTKIGTHFGVRRDPERVDRFGVPPYWLRPYIDLARKL
jgi:hypothetical protein